jgi:glucose-6-phosphate 1-dehydrogenase
VQIVVAEQVGVGRRGGYYETSGALRDMVANHMLQLLTLVAMEAPVALDANAIRDEKVKVLRSVRPMSEDDVRRDTIRGQYDGYRSEEGVAPDSRTETYVAMKLFVDNWRWAGVPFYLRHGKSLPQRATEIVVRWKDAPGVLFNNASSRLKSNMLAMRIQPNEGFALRTNAKVPGSGMEIRDVQMDFDYSAGFGAEPPEAYERLLHDALLGDGTLFTRRDETEVAWSITDAVLKAWERPAQGSLVVPYTYPQGSWGPEEADDFMARDSRRWHQPRPPEEAGKKTAK